MNIINGSKFFNRSLQTLKKFKRNLHSKLNVQIFDLEYKNQLTHINKIFVINLDRQKPRWKKIVKELKLHKTKKGKTLVDYLERVPAVDGKLINPAEYSSKDLNGLYNLKEHFFIDPDPRLSHLVRNKDIRISMTAAEIAVAKSHIKIWEKIVREKIPSALILEDDVYFDENFSSFSKKAWDELPVDGQENKKFDLLYFSFREVDNGAEKFQFSSNLTQPVRGYWWLSGYVLSLQGAEKLIDLLPVCGPVDMWINLQFKNLSVFSVSNSIIHQRRDLESDNSYSIMPILSRAGIHLEKKGKKSKSLITKKPIFAIGLNKTGTTSLHFALTLLGYKCCHWISEDFSQVTAELIDNKMPLPFDAYTDVESITKKYIELDKQYPNAAFILTIRDIEDWISSRSRHVIRNRTENSKGANHNWVDIDIEAWKNERKKHHTEVLDYFKNRKGKLLILDICRGDEWQPLCNFLDLPIPDAAFPNVDPLIKLQTLSRSLMNRIPINGRNCMALKHDNQPWIKEPNKILNYIGDSNDIAGFGNRTGSFYPEITDNFDQISSINWELLENTFPYNLVQFSPNNVMLKKKGGININFKKQKLAEREYTSGAVMSNSNYKFGRFEIEMKPVKANGLISAFFLYRIDPWQEIDIEFLGSDTTKMLANVYFNPGEDGTMNNFGDSGTPVLIDLGFDASIDFHHYAIEWDPNEIRWFVDNDLVHVRTTGYPTPIPDLPMKVHINLWATGNAKLAGKFEYKDISHIFEITSTILSKWSEPVMMETLES